MIRFQNLRVILIGGSSHSGKSTVAQALAGQLGWECRSTDKLARHPGRPWATAPKIVPDHVAAHYLALSSEELVADVLRHYRDNVWPLVEEIVATHAAPAREGMVLEGSALWPELVATLKPGKVAALWLTAENELFIQRIQWNSGYEARAPREREMIGNFLQRTLRYNARMMAAVQRLGLAWVKVDDTATVENVTERCMAELQRQDCPKA